METRIIEGLSLQQGFYMYYLFLYSNNLEIHFRISLN